MLSSFLEIDVNADIETYNVCTYFNNVWCVLNLFAVAVSKKQVFVLIISLALFQ